MSVVKDVTCIIVNYRTPHLIPKVVGSFRRFYKTVPILLVDNGSGNSRRAMDAAKREHQPLDVLYLPTNIYHGPAAHIAIGKVQTRYAFLLDTDCTCRRGRFLELMLRRFHRSDVYAVGKVRLVSRSGVALWPQRGKKGLRYVESWAMMLDLHKYRQLSPFCASGASGINMVHSARRKKFKVASYSIQRHIGHLGAGTRRMFNGAWNPSPNARASKWKGGQKDW